MNIKKTKVFGLFKKEIVYRYYSIRPMYCPLIIGTMLASSEAEIIDFLKPISKSSFECEVTGIKYTKLTLRFPPSELAMMLNGHEAVGPLPLDVLIREIPIVCAKKKAVKL